MATKQRYTEADIASLDWKDHIRHRPGMYIGKLGDGSQADDGIYVLFKEVIDNCIDEHSMGYGKVVTITVEGCRVRVRDYGRGIPLGKVVDCVAKINTGGKYRGEAFTKSVGLNGVGTKAVNALSSFFAVTSFRGGKMKRATFSQGVLQEEGSIQATREADGTEVLFVPDEGVFGPFTWVQEHLLERLRYYAYLNRALCLVLNEERCDAPNGLGDLLHAKSEAEGWAYPMVHLMGEDIALAFTHHGGAETYYSFVNGQHTIQGGTHVAAFKEALTKVVRDFYKKGFEAVDIRQHLVVALSVRLHEPIFESQTKTKLGSQQMGLGGVGVRGFVLDFLKTHLDDYLHQHPAVAEALRERILSSERTRKAMAGVKKLANERAKKARVHNKKLRDASIHYHRAHPRREESTLFITEGNSASGSITQVRDVATQAVFSLRGKPLNSYGASSRITYENEELSLLLHALGIEKGLKGLRYNRVIMATDADVDGMHIRLLLLTYFLQFFPDLVAEGHVYILETPLFRVRSTKRTYYCYNEQEKGAAVATLGGNPEITRFKGLGEISPHEFKHFINKGMRLTPVQLLPESSLEATLRFYMGRNTPERQRFIIDHLRTEV